MEASWWTDPKDLDADQRKVVALGTTDDHLVVGPPGCGKTNLLLLRATYLHKQGVSNIAVLAFGRVLREFLATGTQHYPFSGDKVQTYVRWGTSLLQQNGINFEDGTSFEEVRGRLFDALSSLADAGHAENVYDVILIDEAQDYSGEEIALIRKFSNRLFAVGDRNQQITDKRGALDRIVSLGAKKTELTTHYRNGLKICRVADGIKNLIDRPEGMEANSNYDEATFPSTVDVFGGLSLEEQCNTAISRIQTQLLAYPGEMIGVIIPRLRDLDEARKYFEASALSGDLQVQRSGEYGAFLSDKNVVLMSAAGGKGLEFRAVHMLAADNIKKFPTQRNLAYTTVTRTKTSLSIYHESNLPGYFEKGVGACNTAKPAAPSLDELFI